MKGALFCVAVQWHPENFWRTGEFRPLFDGFIAPAFYLKGLFYFYLGADAQGINMPNLANTAVLALAGLNLFFRTPARILGHALGTFLLFIFEL